MIENIFLTDFSASEVSGASDKLAPNPREV